MESSTDINETIPSDGLFSNTLTSTEIEQLQKGLAYLLSRLKRSDDVSEYDLYEIENVKELLRRATECDA